MLKTETRKTKATAKKPSAAAGVLRTRTASATVTKKSASLTLPSAARIPPTHEEIARRAYEIYLERGGRDGSPFEDWLEAERQLSSGAGKFVRALAPKR